MPTPAANRTRRPARWRFGVVALTTTMLTLTSSAQAQPQQRVEKPGKPDLGPALAGYSVFWASNGKDDLHGKMLQERVLEHNDRLAVWVNRNATEKQQFRALQDSKYQNRDGTAYDQSLTISTGLGSVLGPLYVKGRNSGALPLTSKLLDSSDGTSGAYLGVKGMKAEFSYPRPYLPISATATPVPGDDSDCSPTRVNSSSLRKIRVGKPYATKKGNLKISRLPKVNDTTHRFAAKDVSLSVGYGSSGLCTGGSFPSGHSTTAYQAGITLATLLPELAPEILARTSEAGNNRLVLGVHYPLDVIGGRIAGQASVAARWSDQDYRTKVLLPAREELVGYLKKGCQSTLSECIGRQKPYRVDPYGGRRIPGGTAQAVTDRASALTVYRERLTYGFARFGKRELGPSVPTGADNLLRTTFPTLTEAQRTSVLAQTQIPSGYPLDRSGTTDKSWQRLDLAAAMSATVQVTKGKVTVIATGGRARVVKDRNG